MKLNCIIVDDEPMARKVLEEYIEDVDFLQLIGKAENPVKAGALLENNKVDVMFLDINMPKMSGIDFLRNKSQKPLTVMTTAYTDYAVESFELDVLDYLVKPFSFERFLKAATKAKEYAELQKKQTTSPAGNTAEYFFVKCNGKIEKIFYDELFYVEAMLNYVVLHTEDKKMIVYLTIKSIAEQLPETMFLKIHKSTIINTGKIKSITGNEIDMGKAKVVISQNLHDHVIKEILKDKMLKR
jgi:DNA-binding LytR/AlgR family response regulator